MLHSVSAHDPFRQSSGFEVTASVVLECRTFVFATGLSWSENLRSGLGRDSLFRSSPLGRNWNSGVCSILIPNNHARAVRAHQL